MKMSRKKKGLLWFLTFAVGFIIMWPVYWIIKSSFTQQVDLFKSPIEYRPIHLTLDNYRLLFQAAGLTEYLKGTVIITAVSLILSVFLCALAGYGFARCQTKGLNAAFAFIMFSTMIPGTVTVIPLMTLWRHLGLSDTFAGLVILYFSILIPFSTIMYSGFISQIPSSLEEAARIDGATMAGAFVRIILPLLKPIMATLCIINFITCLNNFFTPLYYSNDIQVLSVAIVQLPLRDNMYGVPWDLVSAMGWIILLPIIIFVAIFEKQIMDGIMAGGVKA